MNRREYGKTQEHYWHGEEFDSLDDVKEAYNRIRWDGAFAEVGLWVKPDRWVNNRAREVVVSDFKKVFDWDAKDLRFQLFYDKLPTFEKFWRDYCFYMNAKPIFQIRR